MSANEALDILTYVEPFSSTHAQPKVPDNKVAASIGKRIKHLYHYKSGVGGGAAPNVLIFLYPGIYQSFCVSTYHTVNADVGTTLFVGKTNIPVHYRFDGTKTFTEVVDQYDSYRMVSSGIRITDIGNDQQTVGYIEAVSVPLPPPEFLTLVGPQATGNTNLNLNCNEVHLKGTYIKEKLMDQDWSEYDSYHVMPIKQLDGMEFINAHLDHDRFFKKITGHTFNASLGLNATTYTYDFGTVAEDLDLYNSIFDIGFKCWAIRIPNVAANVNLLIESVLNVELLPDTESPFHSFASPSQYSNQFNVMKDSLKQEIPKPKSSKEKKKGLGDVLRQAASKSERDSDNASMITRGQAKKSRAEEAKDTVLGQINQKVIRPISDSIAEDIGSMAHQLIANAFVS